MPDLSIPEEAIEKAAIRQAFMATGDEGQWRGYWNYSRAALEAAAPLIVAAELIRLADEVGNPDTRERLYDRAAELRGEAMSGE